VREAHCGASFAAAGWRQRRSASTKNIGRKPRLYSLASIALGGIKLQVREADAGRAADILGVEEDTAKSVGPRGSSASTTTVVSLLLLWALAVGVIVLLVYLFEPFQ
jgi:hypothetical protein